MKAILSLSILSSQRLITARKLANQNCTRDCDILIKYVAIRGKLIHDIFILINPYESACLSGIPANFTHTIKLNACINHNLYIYMRMFPLDSSALFNETILINNKHFVSLITN